MSGYMYSIPVPQSSPNIAPAAAGGTAYTTYVSPVTEQILQTEPEQLASGYVAYAAASEAASAPAAVMKPGYVAFDSSANDDVASVYMEMDGENKNGDARAAAVVQQAKLLELSAQHGDGPLWEKADPRHRIGELLIAGWEIYCGRPGSGPTKAGAAKSKIDFFQWLDAIPEWDRVVMLSNKIRQVGTSVLGTPAQRKLLAAEAPGLAAPGVKNELNLRPSVVKAFVRGVKYLDEALPPQLRGVVRRRSRDVSRSRIRHEHDADRLFRSGIRDMGDGRGWDALCREARVRADAPLQFHIRGKHTVGRRDSVEEWQDRIHLRQERPLLPADRKPD